MWTSKYHNSQETACFGSPRRTSVVFNIVCQVFVCCILYRIKLTSFSLKLNFSWRCLSIIDLFLHQGVLSWLQEYLFDMYSCHWDCLNVSMYGNGSFVVMEEDVVVSLAEQDFNKNVREWIVSTTPSGFYTQKWW